MVYLNRHIFACLCASFWSLPTLANADQQRAVDEGFTAIAAAAIEAGLTPVIDVDHSRLAAKAGVEMPASRVQLFSDAAINTAILSENIRAGLDLPFRALAFDAGGARSVIYTSSDFLAKRYDLKASEALSAFDARLNEVLAPVADLAPTAAPTTDVEAGFGILELSSNYDVATTVARLKETVTAQSDTVWFGEMDFQQEAADRGVTLAPAQLLLFGGPAPGGVAMADFPAIGLDAFCQKLLVYEGEDGKAIVIFNDIAALAMLHYGRSIDPHAMLNKRLTETFKAAIK